MCRTGCPTKDHASWGECARASNLQINSDIKGIPRRRAWDKELSDYSDLRRQGLQPQGTTRQHIDNTRKAADKAYG